VEDAQLVPGVRPQLGEHLRVEVGAVADYHARQQAPTLEVGKPSPHVQLVVAADQSEGDRQVADGIGSQQQSEAAQVKLIDAQRPGELFEDHFPVRGHVELSPQPAQAVVDEALRQAQEEVASHGSDGA